MSANGRSINPGQAGPSAFSVYASRFLAGNLPAREAPDGSQIFRPPSPSSPSHDPFLPSPTASRSHPHLPGASRSPSPARTPPFPGPGIAGIPDIDDSGSGIGVGLLFSDNTTEQAPISADEQRVVPNPYAPSSSESDEDIEADLDEVATVRRSLSRQPLPVRKGRISERSKKGWMAHQSVFPPSSSSDSESEKETEDDTEDERAEVMGRSRKGFPKVQHNQDAEGQILSPSDLFRAGEISTAGDYEQPLLGPDELENHDRSGAKVPVRLQVYHGRFGHWEREGLRKYKDSPFLALWLASILGVLIGLPFVWGSTDPPPDGRSVPSLLPLLPLLLVLVIPALVVPPAFLFLLQRTVRPVLVATAVSIPFSLFLCGWWALGASFETYGLEGVEQDDRWWSTTGLRLVAGVMWLLAAWFGRLVWVRRQRLERTVAVVELATELLLTHPPLLLLYPALLGVFALASIPFLALVLRLAMIGYWRHPREHTWVFHVRPYAGSLIFLSCLIWLWTWSVIKGVGRVAVAAVVGEWYFHRNGNSIPALLEVTTAAVHRATGTSLGSICLGAGIIAGVRMIGRSAAAMKRVTSPKANILPAPLVFLSKLTPVFSIIAGVLDQLNGYALVYVGITGEAFWPSARRAVGLAGRRKGGKLLDYTLIKLLLTLSSTVMGIFTGTVGYLYMTHTLSNPSYAPVAAALCGAVPFLAVRAGAAVLGDAADALFICHQIDRELGGGHSEKAKQAFEGELPRGENAA